MSSQKRAASAQKKEEDALLDQHINANKIETPANLLYVVAGLASFLPAYGYNSITHLSWTELENIPLYIVVPAATTFLLANAYKAMYESEFLKRQKQYTETKTDADASLLKQLRSQAALGYTMFFINAFFVGLYVLFSFYLLRKMDPRAGFLLGPNLVAALLWFIAQKNEESRRRRLRK